MDLIIDFYKDLNFLGPNCRNESIKAINSIPLSSKKDIKVVDMGCGTGRQSEILANELNGKIIAIDLFEEFIESAKKRFFNNNLDIQAIVGDMANLHFCKEEFDLIYSEGAIYSMGFEKGINYWKKFIKPEGYLIVSEVSWLTEKRPREIQSYWDLEYSEIDTIENKLYQLKKAGYRIINHFTLAQKCWKNYYSHVEKHFNAFLKRNKHSKESIQFTEELKHEINMYNKYKDYFGYEFYIVQKIS